MHRTYSQDLLYVQIRTCRQQVYGAQVGLNLYSSIVGVGGQDTLCSEIKKKKRATANKASSLCSEIDISGAVIDISRALDQSLLYETLLAHEFCFNMGIGFGLARFDDGKLLTG